MREAGDKSPDPRNNIFQRITTVLNEWEQRGYHPIVTMDANSTTNDNSLREFMIRHNLRDIIHDFHIDSQGPPPRTYQRSANRLDYIFGNDHVFNSVVGCGSCGLQDAIHSDHTLQWVDFDIAKLFRSTSYDLTSSFGREFSLSNVIKKKAFQTKLTEIYIHQQFCESVQELTDDLATHGALPDLVEQYQRLDYEMVCALQAAASSVAKYDQGYQRSPALVDAGRTISFWRFIMQCIRSNIPYTQRIHNLAQYLEIEPNEYENVSMAFARKQLYITQQNQRDAIQSDSSNRQKWLEALADEIALDNPNTTKEAALRQMISVSSSKALNRTLTNIYKPGGGAIKMTKVPSAEWYYDQPNDELYHFDFDDGVFQAHPLIEGLLDDDSRVFEVEFEIKKPPSNIYRVEVESHDDGILICHHFANEPIEWLEITDSAELEEWFLRRNKKHLQQMWADHSFPASEEFSPFMAEHGTSSVVQDLLDGKLDIESYGFPHETNEVLRVFQRTPEEKQSSIERRPMTKDEFQASFKAAKETTSSSPSGLHYGIWKAAAEINDLAEAHAQMTSLPFVYGFTCLRWQKFIDCILEKSPGAVEIHTVRIIVLVEGQWNTALKHYYPHLLMTEAELTGINGDQWGGRHGRTAPDLKVRKVLFWEYGRNARLTLGAHYGDLMSCYDRKRVPLSNIAAQKKGMYIENCISRALTMIGAERFVKTAAGVSTAAYRLPQ
jgi:hypothetical protein